MSSERVSYREADKARGDLQEICRKLRNAAQSLTSSRQYILASMAAIQSESDKTFVRVDPRARTFFEAGIAEVEEALDALAKTGW
jgi:hypothetical protein